MGMNTTASTTVGRMSRLPGTLEVRTAGKTPAPCVFTKFGEPVARFERVEDAEAFAALPDVLAALRLMMKTFPPPPIQSKNGMDGNIAHAAAGSAIHRATMGSV